MKSFWQVQMLDRIDFLPWFNLIERVEIWKDVIWIFSFHMIYSLIWRTGDQNVKKKTKSCMLQAMLLFKSAFTSSIRMNMEACLLSCHKFANYNSDILCVHFLTATFFPPQCRFFLCILQDILMLSSLQSIKRKSYVTYTVIR